MLNSNKNLQPTWGAWLGPVAGLTAFVAALATGVQGADTTSTPKSATNDFLIPTVSQQELLERIDHGEQVVFVDAREAAEHHEEHIPGATDLPLRDVNPETVKALHGKPVVVAYCLKDFRGFELAKALTRAGVENVYVMGKSGINGWKALGLPITGGKAGLSEAVAIEKLGQCARTKTCIKGQKA